MNDANLAHLVLGQKGSRHKVDAEFEANLSRRGKLNKIWIYCPNKTCLHHLSFELSSKPLLLKCPICSTIFNPYTPAVVQCRKCKTRNSAPLYMQIIQCANKRCKRILNCWPVFRVEAFEKKKKNSNNTVDRVNLDSDEDTKENKDDDDDDVVEIVDRERTSIDHKKNDGGSRNMKRSKIEPKDETFLMVKESEIGVYRDETKKKKLYAEQRVIRMENDNGLVVIINNSTRFKAKQNVIREPKEFKSPFEWFHAKHLKEWKDRYPDYYSIQLTIKMKKYWDSEMLEAEKTKYTEMSTKDKQRYMKELEVWNRFEWMMKKPYD